MRHLSRVAMGNHKSRRDGRGRSWYRSKMCFGPRCVKEHLCETASRVCPDQTKQVAIAFPMNFLVLPNRVRVAEQL